MAILFAMQAAGDRLLDCSSRQWLAAWNESALAKVEALQPFELAKTFFLRLAESEYRLAAWRDWFNASEARKALCLRRNEELNALRKEDPVRFDSNARYRPELTCGCDPDTCRGHSLDSCAASDAAAGVLQAQLMQNEVLLRLYDINERWREGARRLDLEPSDSRSLPVGLGRVLLGIPDASLYTCKQVVHVGGWRAVGLYVTAIVLLVVTEYRRRKRGDPTPCHIRILGVPLFLSV
ncbi:MAG: hypothetical protein HY720_14000 [Planctomycetes bacterium]|nr:hypothetical protein [Planctomycetota bacterium]